MINRIELINYHPYIFMMDESLRAGLLKKFNVTNTHELFMKEKRKKESMINPVLFVMDIYYI